MVITKRTAVFIDGSNLHATLREAHMPVDYQKLRALFNQDGSVVCFKWFTAIPADKEEYSSFRTTFDHLSYNGDIPVTKPTKVIGDKMKGNMDGEIILHAVDIRESITHFVLFSGDGDFVCLVEYLQRYGIHVTVVSTRGMIADELRRACNLEIDIKDLRNDLMPERKPENTERPKSRFSTRT